MSRIPANWLIRPWAEAKAGAMREGAQPIESIEAAHERWVASVKRTNAGVNALLEQSRKAAAVEAGER